MGNFKQSIKRINQMYNVAYTLAIIQALSYTGQSLRITGDQATPSQDGVSFGATINGDIHVNSTTTGGDQECEGCDCDDIELIHVRGVTESRNGEGEFEEVDILLHVDGMYNSMEEFRQAR